MKKHHQIILGAWLTGHHADDRKLFTVDDFSGLSPTVLQAILDGAEELSIINGLKPTKDEILTMVDCQTEFTRLDVHGRLYSQSLKETLKEQTKRRVLQDHVDGKDIFDTISSSIDTIDRIKKETGEVVKPEKNLIGIAKDMLERARTEEALSWGIPFLNNLTGGLHRKELTTVAARPGVGKSAFALQLALSTAVKRKQVLFFSLEMGIEQLLQRIILREDLVDKNGLRRGVISETQQARMEKILNTIERSGLELYTGANKLEQIEATVADRKPPLVIIDQLSFIKPAGKFNSEREMFQETTRRLKQLSLVEDVAVVLLAQLNREAEGVAASMHHLKSSGQTEEDSDNVLLLSEVPKEQAENQRLASDIVPVLFNLAKHRNGPKGYKEILLKPDKVKFYEVEGRQ